MPESKKRSEEISIEIKEQNEEYAKLLKECQKLAEIKTKQYERELETLNISTSKTHQEIILKLGRFLARHQLKHDPSKISAKLKRDLANFIHRSTVFKHALPEWRQQSFNKNPGGRNQYSRATDQKLSLNRSSNEPFTEQDKRYLEAYENETIRNELIDKIVEQWTGITKNQIPDISYRTEKGKHWAQTLADERTDYMKKIGHQMTDSAIHGTLVDLRVLNILGNKFSDILLEIREQRKRSEALESI